MDLFALDANAFLLLAPPASISLSGLPPLQFVLARQGRSTSFRLANFQDYLPVLLYLFLLLFGRRHATSHCISRICSFGVWHAAPPFRLLDEAVIVYNKPTEEADICIEIMTT